MEYWRDGSRVARLDADEMVTAEIFSLRRGAWVLNEILGGEIRFTGNFVKITEAEALELVRSFAA